MNKQIILMLCCISLVGCISYRSSVQCPMPEQDNHPLLHAIDDNIMKKI